MNELLLIVEIIVIFVFLLYFCKQFRELGLIIWMILMSIISNILCLKIVNIFGFDISLGFVPYVSIFIAFNIYIQRCGIKNLYKIITCVILSLIFSYFIIYLSSLYLSGMLNINNNLSYTKLFEIDTRLVISSLISLAISLYLNGQIYYIVRKVKNKMWLSNLLSIIVVQFLDTILFILIYFLGNLPIIDIALMMVIRYTFKLIIGIAATGIIYKGNRLLR